MKIWDLLRNRDRAGRALQLLDTIEKIAEGVLDRAELGARLAEGAHRGDLDDVISWARAHDEKVRRFREGR